MGPGASGSGARTATAPPSVLGSGVSLHAYDIGVLVVYFVFVICVGIWVSGPEGWGLAGRQGQALTSGWSRSQSEQGEGGSRKHRTGWRGLQESFSPIPSFIDGQTEAQKGV